MKNRMTIMIAALAVALGMIIGASGAWFTDRPPIRGAFVKVSALFIDGGEFKMDLHADDMERLFPQLTVYAANGDIYPAGFEPAAYTWLTGPRTNGFISVDDKKDFAVISLSGTVTMTGSIETALVRFPVTSILSRLEADLKARFIEKADPYPAAFKAIWPNADTWIPNIIRFRVAPSVSSDYPVYTALNGDAYVVVQRVPPAEDAYFEQVGVLWIDGYEMHQMYTAMAGSPDKSAANAWRDLVQETVQECVMKLSYTATVSDPDTGLDTSIDLLGELFATQYHKGAAEDMAGLTTADLSAIDALILAGDWPQWTNPGWVRP